VTCHNAECFHLRSVTVYIILVLLYFYIDDDDNDDDAKAI